MYRLVDTEGLEDRNSTSTSVLLLEKDVFTCSELERASFCLAAADECLRSLQHFLDSGTKRALVS